VPALVDHSNSDFTVWESGAILLYRKCPLLQPCIAALTSCAVVDKYDKSGQFHGKTPEERAITNQWLTHQLSGLGPVQGNVNYVSAAWNEAWAVCLHARQAHHYWEGTYNEKPQKSVFTR
jgi:glutathione S-transferase